MFDTKSSLVGTICAMKRIAPPEFPQEIALLFPPGDG